MKRISFFSIQILALASVRLVAVAAADSPTTASSALIGRLMQEAVATHPSMEAARARTDAAKATLGTIRLWQDPQLGLGTLFASQMNRQGNGDITVSLDQTLPRPKLYQAEKRRAAADELAQKASRQQTANELSLMVAQAVLELALADEVVRLQGENVRWLQTIVKTAEERSKSPDATATETLRLESELAVQQQTLASAERQRSQYAASLNLLLGRPIDRSWPALALPAQPLPTSTFTALKVRLERQNPKLAALRHQVEGAQADADAAREKRKPAFTVGVQINAYSGGNSEDTMGMLTVGMNLPWFNRSAYKADIVRAEKQRDAASSDLAAEQRLLLTQATKLLSEAETNRRVVEAYGKDVLPKTEKTVETIQNAWISSKATLLEVLEARRTLLQARQEQKRSLAAQHVAAQMLASLSGSPIESPAH
ncbi:MAG TPA: TolC family protein [Prosthecobacter sp.]